MKMTQEQAVQMLTEIGYKTSNKWDLERINLKLAKLQDQLDGTEEMETEEGKKLLAKALKALKAGEEVVAEAGEAEEVEEAAPAKKSKKASKEEVAEEEEEEEEPEEEPEAKPAKKKGKPAAPVEEKPAKKASKPAKAKASEVAKDKFGCREGYQAALINACITKTGWVTLDEIIKQCKGKTTAVRARGHLARIVNDKLVRHDKEKGYRQV